MSRFFIFRVVGKQTQSIFSNQKERGTHWGSYRTAFTAALRSPLFNIYSSSARIPSKGSFLSNHLSRIYSTASARNVVTHHAQVAWKRLHHKYSVHHLSLHRISTIAQAFTLSLTRSHFLLPGIISLTCGQVAWAQRAPGSAIDHYASDKSLYTRDGNERLREREDLDKLKLTHEDGLSARGRERQLAVRGHRVSEDRSSRMKDEYKASDKEHLTKDTTRHTKQTKRREYPGEESSSHHRGHEDFSARTDDIVNNEKKPRQEKTGAKSEKVIDTSDGQRLQDRKHKDSRRKIKEQREGTESLRSKQGEQNGSSEVTGSKGTNEARNCRSDIPQHPNSTKRHKENASSGDELQDSKKGRTKLERWASHKDRDDAVTAKSLSISSKLQEKEKNTNGRLNEAVHGSIGKNRDVTEEKSSHDLAETKDGSEKGPGDRHLDTVEKLKKRSERFKLPMPTEKDTTGVKKMESETLPSAKIEGPVNSEVKAERPARKRRWTSS